MATTPVSPKVKAGANWAAYATLALTLFSVVTPDSLSFMGHLAPLAYGVVVGGTYALGAFLKSDDLRDAGAAKIAADAIAAAASATSANLPAVSIPATPAPTLTALAPVADTSLPAVDVSQPASTGAVDGGFQSKIEAAISGATPAADPAPAATPAPAAVPAQPAQ